MYEEAVLVKEGTCGTALLQKGLYQALVGTRRNLERPYGHAGITSG